MPLQLNPITENSYRDTLHTLLPGFGVAAITGMAALFLSEHYGAPVMLLALLLGIGIAFLYEETKCKAGIDFVASHVLRFGVALVGIRIAISDLINLGWQTALMLICAIASTILLGIFISRLAGLPKYFGALTGGAVGICGASAALAISSVLPDSEQKQRDTLLTVIGVTLMSTIAMVLYPIIAKMLGLNQIETSIFLGGTIHDVAQVVGAGYSVSVETGDLATLTKLVRVSFLVPVVLLFTLVIRARRKQNTEQSATVFPLFLVGFITLMLINSIVNIPDIVIENATDLSRFALVLSVAAIGMKSNLRQLLDVGWMPLAILLIETLWIAALFLAYLLV